MSPEPLREHSLAVDGIPARYLDAGTGEPVLFLHGASLGSSCDVWERTVQDFGAQRFHAIAPDLPGFGGTPAGAVHSVAHRRRFVLAFMDALQLDRAHLVGHSQSGRIVVELALDHSRRVASALVLGTGSLLPRSPESTKQAGEGEEGGATEPTLAETRALLESTLFHRELATDAAVELRHRMSIGAPFAAFMARKTAPRGGGEKNAPPLWQRLADIRVPLLMLYGEQDRGDAAVRVAQAKARFPQLDICVLPNCKHLVQWDAADALVQLGVPFMRAAKVHSAARA